MKTFLFSFSFLITSFAFSQVPDYFPDGAVWNETYVEELGGNMTSDCGSVSNYNFSIQEDVLLGGVLYKNMHKNGVLSSHYSILMPQSDYNPSCNFTVPITDDYYVRQDSLKIYVYLTDSTEHLLYDFDLVVGDTFEFSGIDMFNNFSNTSVQCVVDSIDSIYVKDMYRNVFYVSHDDYGGLGGVDTNSVFIEGIGNLGGFFCDISRFTEYTTRTLECFGINDTSYFSGQNGFCDFNVGVQEIRPEIVTAWYPNPVSHNLTIELGNSVNIKKIDLFDMSGRQSALDFEDLSSGKIGVDLSKKSDGFYLLKMYDDSSKEVVIKIQKQ